MALSKNAKVAFIGTGIMGAPIAEHLISAGYDVTVYNRTPEKAQKLVSLGAHAAENVADAVKDADVVFTMVGYPTDVEDVYLATDGLIRVAKKGAYLIDLTTSSSQLARDIHDAAEIEGKHAFDCPVTGGQKGAQDGTLTLIVGATEHDIEPVRALLETFSAKIFCMGGAGKGQTAKLCNQVSLASCMIGYADAMALKTSLQVLFSSVSSSSNNPTKFLTSFELKAIFKLSPSFLMSIISFKSPLSEEPSTKILVSSIVKVTKSPFSALYLSIAYIGW